MAESMHLPNETFPAQVTKALLDSHVGTSVEDFCKCKFGRKGDEHNHCAHWVSHALGFRIGKLCNRMTWEFRKDPDEGRSLVVSDLFNACLQRGPWAEKPLDLDCCLIFAVVSIGLNRKPRPWVMDNVRRKHIGIYLKGECYNYHNRTNEGVRIDGVHFFGNLYGRDTVALYGTFPE